MATLMVLDGNSLTYRAFFALPTDLATASGQVTNAVFGFTSMLVNLVRDHKPDRVVVTFDRPEPTFRHEALPTYKGNRAETPDLLRQQMGLVREVLEALVIPMLEAPGHEADDIIATLASQARDAGDDVLIVTGDRDSYQLVEDPHVRVLYNRRGVSDYALYDEAGILERTGVTPALYPQYAALRGDPSDNLPGVPGVGEKTAAKLITTYGGLDGIFANLEAQTPKLRANLAEHEAQARQNFDLMVLNRAVPLDVDQATLVLGEPDPEVVRRLFDFLEFRSIYERLGEAFPQALPGGVVSVAAREVLEAEVATCSSPAEAVVVLDQLAAGGSAIAVAAAWVGDEGRSALDGLAVVTDSSLGEVAWLPATVIDAPEVLEAFRKLVSAGGPPLVAHSAKPLMRALAQRDVDVQTLGTDTMLAAYLVDPAESRYALGDLLARYADLELADSPPAEAAQGSLDFDGSSVAVSQAAGRRALATARLAPKLEAALDAQSMGELYQSVEQPLVRVLARMEDVGVAVDRDELVRLRDDLAARGAVLEARIHELAGRPFVINSTKQLQEVLFDELGLVPQKKTAKGARSTDAASLEKLKGEHEIVDALLEYREVEKLRSTYGEGLLAEVADDGRIHATFNQTVARTGRLSSDAPNLHNIPVRSEVGRAFRKAFVPAPGTIFCVADYNQIELRVIAHLAEDPGLIDAFTSGRDIHTATASKVFAVEPGDVTIAQRSKAKMVSYGLAYGMEAYGLGQRLSIPTAEAAEILDAYFEAFPNVRAYMRAAVDDARAKGYTETLFGRRRPIPELASSNFRLRQAGERQAMNAGIQGLAADIFKVALVRLDAALEAAGDSARLILQVHDEVILEVAPDAAEATGELVTSILSGAAELSVPLEVNLSFGPTWADAKG